jgi:predicted metal-binding membrane protein
MSSALSRSQRLPPVSLLLVVAAAAWLCLVVVANHMGSMPGTMGLGPASFASVWVLMMAAMMLPSVAPFAALYTRTFGDDRVVRMVAFASGYLLVWSAAAIPAYGLAYLADRATPGHQTAAKVLAVAIFAACGIYQLTPLKDRCLAHCRSPLGFVFKFAAYQGRTRDLRVGLYHGAFCLGCCWALMILLIAFGLMNLAAMVVLAAVVLAEKTWRWGQGLSKALGVAALILAVLVIFRPGLAPGLDPTVAHEPMGGMQ